MYGKWLYKEIGTEYGACMVEIYRKNYTGESIEIGALAADSLSIALENLGSITDPIGKSVCSFSIIDTNQVEYDDFFTPDATALKVVVSTRVGGGAYVTRWSGYVTPDFFAENLSYRTPISISARDNIGYLNDVDFDLTATTVTVREFIQSAFKRIAEDYPMSLSFVTQKQTAEGILAIDATISTTLLREMSWGEALETILHDLGLQMRWVDNNTIVVLDLSQIPEYYAAQGFNFIGASGYREIVPAWRELSQKQEYGLIENFFRGRISEEDLTFVKEEQVVIDGYNTSTMRYYSPKNWLGNGLTINYNDYFFSIGGTMSESERNRIYFTGISKDTTAYIDKYMGWRQPVYKSNNAMKISFKALNSIQVVSQYSLPGLPILQTFGPYSPGTAQFGLKVNVLLHSGTKTYIMRYKWEELNTDETDAINFVLPILQGNANEEECTIDLGNIPYDGELELRIYGWYFIEATNWTAMPLNAVSYITDVVYSYDTNGAISGRDAKVQVSELHNVKNDTDYSFGEVPLDCGGINAYAGGLYKSDGDELIGFQRNADATNYNLLELVGREIIHFNKRNYNRLSGTIRNLDKEPLMFNRLFMREGKKYAPYNYSLNVISNEMNITSMQEVEPYTTVNFSEVHSEVSTGGSTVSSGNNQILQYSAEVGNAKRLYELQPISENEKPVAYVLVDGVGFPEARKLKLTDIAGLDEKALEQYLVQYKYLQEGDLTPIIQDFEKLEEAVNPLFGYFDANGNANNALKLGGHSTEYFATADALAGVANTISAVEKRVTTLEDLGLVRVREGSTYYIKSIYSIVSEGELISGRRASGSSSDVTGGGGISQVTAQMIVDALGYVPYSSLNPAGYITSSALNGYATQTWVEAKKYLTAIPSEYITETELSNTLGGYQTKITSSNKLAYSLISGTPSLATVATSGKYSDLSGVPTSLPASDVYAWAKKSSLAASDVPDLSSKYLPLSGGTIGDTTFTALSLTRTNSNKGVGLHFSNSVDGNLGYILMGGSGSSFGTGPFYRDTSDAYHALIHSGNYSDYALPKSGGTMQGDIILPERKYIRDADNTAIFGYNTTQGILVGSPSKKLSLRSGEDAIINGNTLIHSGNIGSYNAGSATKLQTARSLWGQSFDGTGDIDGRINISNNTGIYLRDSGGNARRAFYLNASNVLYIGNDTAVQGYDTCISGRNIHFRYSADRKVGMSLTSTGNVLVGTTSDNGHKLQVVGGDIYTSSYMHSLAYKTNDSYGLWKGSTFTSALSANDIALYGKIIHCDGNVLIGTTSDNGAKLQVNGNLTATGEVISTRRATSSDARLKDNINRLLAEDCLAMVRNLQPSSWDWKNDGKHSLGFIAQDVEQYMPYAVTRTKDDKLGEKLNLQYDQFFAPVVGAIQCLDIKVNSHEDEIESLKNEVAELRQKLSKYETVWQ